MIAPCHRRSNSRSSEVEQCVRIVAHSVTCPKCNQVSAADSIVAMPRMTAKLFREILDSIEGDIETLEIEKTVTEGEDVPTQAERSAIERVQSTLNQSKAAIEVQLEVKQVMALTAWAARSPPQARF